MTLKTIELKVADYMTPNPISVGPEFPFQDAIGIMEDKGIGNLVVKEDHVIKGLFTERDLLVNVLSNEVDLKAKVGGYCSSPLITAKIGIGGNEAANLMAEKKIKRLMLTDKEKMVGIVTARDVVDAFQMAENF